MKPIQFSRRFRKEPVGISLLHLERRTCLWQEKTKEQVNVKTSKSLRKLTKTVPLEEAVTQAVDDCIKDGVLAEFLSKNRREAIRVSILECDVDKVMDYLKKEAKEDGHAEGLAAGRAEGLATGRAEGLLSSVQAIMKNLNMTPIQAMDTLNIPAEERENLLKQLND